MSSDLVQYVTGFLSKDSEVRPVSTSEADILSNYRRREVLRVLLDEDREVDVGDLSTILAEWEYGSNYSSSERQAVYSSLNGTHLPNLDEAGILDYDKDGRLEVQKISSLGELEEYLEHYPSRDSLFPGARETHLQMPEEDLLTMDDGFHVLSNDRRRFVLDYIASNKREEFDFKELYRGLASSETMRPVEELSADDWKNQNISLRQDHLPVMDELEIVDFDGEENIVVERPYLESMAEYIPEDENFIPGADQETSLYRILPNLHIPGLSR